MYKAHCAVIFAIAQLSCFTFIMAQPLRDPPDHLMTAELRQATVNLRPRQLTELTRAADVDIYYYYSYQQLIHFTVPLSH